MKKDETEHEHEHEDVEEYSYSCFDTCDRYPDGCKDCDQVMHEGFGYEEGKGKDQPKKE